MAGFFKIYDDVVNDGLAFQDMVNSFAVVADTNHDLHVSALIDALFASVPLVTQERTY
jgi:hypothetical protein